MIGIYKIENLINNKKYIGQSIDIETRWKHHQQAAYNKNSKGYEYPLYRAIRKYGIENFKFNIIEECELNQLNTREIYWISYYDSFFKGYNQTLGGDCSGCTDKENLIKILDLLENTTLTHADIAKECKISTEMVQSINTGRYWHDINREYPIRKRKLRKKNYCKDCGIEINYKSIRCTQCENKHRLEVNVNNMKVSKEELNDLIHKYSFIKIGEMFGVSDNAIRKWCQKYGLPCKRKDLYLKTA